VTTPAGTSCLERRRQNKTAEKMKWGKEETKMEVKAKMWY
jgi:hypothetical protein